MLYFFYLFFVILTPPNKISKIKITQNKKRFDSKNFEFIYSAIFKFFTE